MGLNHARCIARLSEAELVSVVDTHADRAERAAKEFGCAGLTDSTELIGRIDAVSVATPAATHAKVATPLLEAGVPCLVEKPLALAPADITRMIAAAGKAVLRVGHIERFNPNVKALMARRPLVTSFEARRLNAPGRAVALDVVTDLMVHDLDLASILMMTPVAAVTAERRGDDHVAATVTFADGSRATFEASRRAMTPVRELIVTADGRPERIDLTARAAAADGSDPLSLEIKEFLAAIGGVQGFGATAEEARQALDLVWRINRALEAA